MEAAGPASGAADRFGSSNKRDVNPQSATLPLARVPTDSQPVQWYSWGSNASGLLALGHTNDSSTPTLITAAPFAHSATSAPVVSCACSGVYSLACTTDGELWHCGDTHQSCSSSTAPSGGQRTLSLPARIPLPHRIAAVACGWTHCGCISDDGQLFMWGSNEHRQLGIIADGATAVLAMCHTPTLVPLPEPATAVACGWRHTLALTSSHRVLGWGANSKGQMPSASKLAVITIPTALSLPATLPANSHITSVHASMGFSLLLASCGRVYGAGLNKYGQLGVARETKRLTEWTEVPDTRAIRAAVGWSHCMLLDADGVVRTLGRRNLGQSGLGLEALAVGSSHVPCVVDVGDGRGGGTGRVVDVVCGSESCACVDGDGAMWSWGWNEHGNVGALTVAQGEGGEQNSLMQIVSEPHKILVGEAGEKVVAVVVGGASVFVAVAQPCGIT